MNSVQSPGYSQTEYDEVARVLSDIHQVGRWHELLRANTTAMKVLVDRPEQFDDTAIAAIGFDTNAIVKLRTNTNIQDKVKQYLVNNRHEFTCIFPSQAMLEFWNNSVNAIAATYPKFDSNCEKLIQSLEDAAGFFSSESVAQLREIKEQAANYKPDKMSEDNQLFQRIFGEFACFPAVPRGQFLDVYYRIRKEAGFPPGFEDKGKERNLAGDFLVWAGFLLGCSCDARDKLRKENKRYVVFVSNEKKVDWLPNGYPHPALLAEVDQLLGKELLIIDLDTFMKKVASRESK